MDYDTAWKRLFGLPILVEHLLRGFIAPAARWLDFGTLRELSASWTDTGRQQRHGDAAWRVDYADDANGSGRSLVLLLEFQSGVDQSMASRVQRYKGMAYEELRRQGESDACGQLRLLPIVIHSGEQPWTAPGGITEISVADDGEILLPLPYSYLSLDVQRLPQDHLPSRNIVATVFKLETLKSSADMVACIQDLSDWLPDVAGAATGDTVLTTILEWILTLRPRMFPGSGTATAVAELQQVLRERENKMSLLAERAKQWEAEWLQQGIEQGMERGVEHGLAAERELLSHLAERKFDLATAQELARRIASVTDTKRLAEVGSCIIDSATGGELLENMDTI